MAGFNQAEVADIKNDCILVQTDCTFNIALAIFRCLEADCEFHVCSSEVVTIRNIESDDPDEEFSLRFGGTSHHTSPLQYFAQTAFSVLGMMILKSVNANQKWFSNMGRRSGPRNSQKMLH